MRPVGLFCEHPLQAVLHAEPRKQIVFTCPRCKVEARTHKLVIHYLHDARLSCSCGGWHLIRTGEMTRQEARAAHRQHVNGLLQVVFRGVFQGPVREVLDAYREHVRKFHFDALEDCGCCGGFHFPEFTGDCREDWERF